MGQQQYAAPHAQPGAHSPGGHHQPQGQQQRARRQRVHAVLLVRARPMYGYHSGEQLYAKIML